MIPKSRHDRMKMPLQVKIDAPDESNRMLSLNRARAVKDFLTAAKISGDRLTISGEGSSSPVASNESEEGKAKNRRVEILIE